MTTRTDLTDEEWDRLRRGPIVAGFAISIADPGGPIEATKETLATIRVLASPPSGHPLLEEIATEVRERAQQRENVLGDFRLERGAMAGQSVLDELRAVDIVLRTRLDESEAQAYREWLLSAATAAAEAAKEGGFLGFGATQVSEGEADMLERVRDALGMTSDVAPGAEPPQTG
jgi:hypothetical protein